MNGVLKYLFIKKKGAEDLCRDICTWGPRGRHGPCDELSPEFPQRVYAIPQPSDVQSGRVAVRVAPLHSHHGGLAPQLLLPGESAGGGVHIAEGQQELAHGPRLYTAEAARSVRPQQAHLSPAMAHQPKPHWSRNHSFSDPLFICQQIILIDVFAFVQKRNCSKINTTAIGQ